VDSDMESLSGLEGEVRASRVLLAIMSANYFSSHWCMQEVQCAVKHGVRVVTVVLPGARFSDGPSAATFPPAAMVPEALHSALLARKAVPWERSMKEESYRRLLSQLQVNGPLMPLRQQSAAQIAALDWSAANQLVSYRWLHPSLLQDLPYSSEYRVLQLSLDSSASFDNVVVTVEEHSSMIRLKLIVDTDSYEQVDLFYKSILHQFVVFKLVCRGGCAR
jgi:hypothetical protein